MNTRRIQRLTPNLLLGLALLVSLATTTSCAPPVDVEQAVLNAYEGRGLRFAETRDYVYIARPLRELTRQEQIEAYDYALDTLVLALQDSDITRVPGSETLLDRMWEVNLEDTIGQLEADLDAYQDKIEDDLEVVSPSVNFAPTAIALFVGMPVSASAIVGGSGSLTGMVIIKPYKVTRIDKHTGDIDDAWHRWTWEYSDAAILKAGVGFGAGGGLGLHGGLGLIWGELAHPADFRGQTAMLSMVPLQGGVGPLVKAGVRWNNLTESADPQNFFALVGIEAGATAKAFETHIQAGNITGLWRWVVQALGFDAIAEQGELDPAELE